MLRTIFGVFFLVLAFESAALAKPDDWMALYNQAVPDYTFRINFRNSVDKALLESQFEALDAAATSFRTLKRQSANGEWTLSVIYEELSYYLRDVPEADWVTRLERLQAWVAAKPESITARIALAECLIGYAFHGRGGNYAPEVTAQQWGTFDERMNKAEKILHDARSLKQKCPEWWAAYQRLALGNMNRSDYDRLFDAAIADEPSYNTFYFRKAWYLLPWWNGEEGDWEQFAKVSADNLGGKEGDILYARIVWFIDRRAPNKVVDNNPRISWDRVKRGIELIKSGESIKTTPQVIDHTKGTGDIPKGSTDPEKK
jgi:hypothetical protein